MIDADTHTVDAAPEEYRRLYWEYLNDPATDTEHVMTAAEYVQWRRTNFERDSNLDSI